MPQILKSAKDGQIAVKEFYTVGDLAYLMGVAHSTAIRLIDQREIGGFWLPTKRRQRRVTHGALVAFVRRNPDLRYMLDKLKGHDPRVDFPVGAEPPPPARPIGPAAPWGPEPRGRQSAARSPRRHTTQRRKSPSSSGSRGGPSSRSWTQRSSRASGSPPRDSPLGNGESCTGLWSPSCGGTPATVTRWTASRAASPVVIAPPGRSPSSPQAPQAGGGARTRHGAAASSAVPNCPTDASRRRPERRLPRRRKPTGCHWAIHGRNGDQCCWREKGPRKSGRSKRRSIQGLVFFSCPRRPRPAEFLGANSSVAGPVL